MSERSERAGQLKKFSLVTELTQPVSAIPEYFGGSWGEDGTIVTSTSCAIDTSTEHVGFGGKEVPRVLVWPQLLPGGRSGLFVDADAAPWGEAAVLDLRSRQLHGLGVPATFARYVPTGHLLTLRPDGTLLAAPFEPAGGGVKGRGRRRAQGRRRRRPLGGSVRGRRHRHARVRDRLPARQRKGAAAAREPDSFGSGPATRLRSRPDRAGSLLVARRPERGGVETLVEGGPEKSPLAFTADGRSLLFAQPGSSGPEGEYWLLPFADKGPPRRLLEGPLGHAALSPDGNGFVAIFRPSGFGEVRHLQLVTNWFEELERLVPGAKRC